MKQSQVTVGKVYAIKIGDRLCPVRLDRTEDRFGGWWATNLKTGRTVRVKTAAKCRFEVVQADGRWVKAI